MPAYFFWQGDRTPVQSARFALTLETESWEESTQTWEYGRQLSLQASLEVVVDEDSGEDGAPAPDAHWRLEPIPEDVFHSCWDDDAPDFEAWFGNDAPELENNRLELLGRQGQQVLVRWRADCEDEEMRFEGPVEFAGLNLRVLQPEDAGRFLRQLWPSRDWTQVLVEEGESIDFGAIPGQDRRWLSFTFRW